MPVGALAATLRSGPPAWGLPVLTPLIFRRRNAMHREPPASAGRAVGSHASLPQAGPMPSPLPDAGGSGLAQAKVRPKSRTKDLLQREDGPTPRREPTLSPLPVAIDTGPVQGEAGVKKPREDPLRRETGPATRRAASPSDSSPLGLQPEDPMRRENGSASPTGRTDQPRGTTAVTPRGENLMRREDTTSRTGPLRNGNPRGNPNLSPRCGARTRLDCPCRGPAMANGRCRMHGGTSTGPRTPEGLARLRAARTRHAPHVAEALAFNRTCRQLIQRANTLLALARLPAAERQAVDLQTLLPSPLPVPPPPSRHRSGGKTLYAVRMTRPPSSPTPHLPAEGLIPGASRQGPPRTLAVSQDPMRREAARITPPEMRPPTEPGAGVGRPG
jgi:hypothetical protein